MGELKKDIIFTYDAFISYRHGELDGKIAEILHQELENYILPRELQKLGSPKKLTRIFKDTAELPTSSSLTDNIKDALQQSRFLIVVCSPRTPESLWVQREIEYFKELGREDRILAVLIKGTPKEAFPMPLFTITGAGKDDTRSSVVFEDVIEPLAADIRAESYGKALKRLKTEKLRLIAPIIGCGFDDIMQRQKQRQKSRNIKYTCITSAICLLLICAVIIAGQQWTNYARKTFTSEIETNLNSINSRYDRLRTVYELIKNNEILWKESAEAAPKIADITVPPAIKQTCYQFSNELKSVVKEYPLYWAEAEGRQLPKFTDWKGERNKRLSDFNQQIKSLDQNWGSIMEVFDSAPARITSIDTGINQEKLIAAKMEEFFANSKLAYTLGILSLKDIDHELFQKEANALKSKTVLKDIVLPKSVPTLEINEVKDTQSNNTSITQPINTPTPKPIERNKSTASPTPNSTDIQNSEQSDKRKIIDDDLQKKLDLLINATEPDLVAAGARTLRDLGRYEEAAAQYDKYAEMFSAGDPTAEGYAAAGKKFALKQSSLKIDGGLYIYIVADGGAGAKAGIQIGDILISYNGKYTYYAEDLQSVMKEVTKGSEVNIDILRIEADGNFKKYTLKIPSGAMGIGFLTL